MDVTRRDLILYTNMLNRSLDEYATLLPKQVAFGNFQTLEFTPDKPNTARTIVPVLYQGVTAGRLYTILFKPGDGTGDTSFFTTDDLDTSANTTWHDAGTKVYPRKKTCAMEAFFPFFSARNGYTHPNATCLEEIGTEKGKLGLLWHLGVTPSDFETALTEQRRHLARIQLTTGHYRNGERFGDPHAVYANPREDAIQVGGFLSLEEDNPLCLVFDEIAVVPRR